MYTNKLVFCLGVFLLLDSFAFGDRRLTQSQYANIDFLQNEANQRKPSSPAPSDPNQRVGNIKPNPSANAGGTSTTLSPIRQLIKNVNDNTFELDKQKIGGSQPANSPSQNTNINGQNNPQGSNANSQLSNNKNPNASPTPTTPNRNNQPAFGGPTPTYSIHSNNPPAFGGPTSTSTTNKNNQPNIGMNSQQNNKNQIVGPTPMPLIPNRNNQPSTPVQRPNSAPQSPSKEAFPSLPGSHTVALPGTPAAPANPTPKPMSWSSVVSGRKPSTGGSTLPNQNTANQPIQPTPPNSAGLTPQTNPTGYPTLAESAKIGNKKNQNGPTSPAVEIVSDSELKTLSETLLTKDTNNAAKYITVNYQGKTSSFSQDDVAPQPLLSIQPAVWNIPTVAALRALYDNYEQDTTVNEYVTPLEKNEENAFMDAIMATSVVRQLMTFLKDKGVVSVDPKQQRELLKSIWFNMYSRGQGRIGSSGFEHIFLSEVKNSEISGLHNWIYFHTEEAANRANYLGYLKKVDIPNKGAILKLHFNMNGIDKPVDTMFVGTSPELEIALYSLCFLTRADKACPLSLGGENFNLRTHNYRYRSKNMIGSAFPEI